MMSDGEDQLSELLRTEEKRGPLWSLTDAFGRSYHPLNFCQQHGMTSAETLRCNKYQYTQPNAIAVQVP